MDQGSDSRRRSMALELERLARVKAAEGINGEARRAEQDVARDCEDRGVLHSGIFCGRIADVHRERAKRIVDKYIELRRATLERAPEGISEAEFRSGRTPLGDILWPDRRCPSGTSQADRGQIHRTASCNARKGTRGNLGRRLQGTEIGRAH